MSQFHGPLDKSAEEFVDGLLRRCTSPDLNTLKVLERELNAFTRIAGHYTLSDPEEASYAAHVAEACRRAIMRDTSVKYEETK